MSAVNLLGDAICHGGKLSVASLRNPRDVHSLIGCGLLRDAGVVASYVCMECDEPHTAEVVFEQGTYGFFCPDLGHISLKRQQIAAVEPNMPSLIECLADTFSCTRRKTSPVHGNTWRIGALRTDHGDVTLYFHPRLVDEADARDLANALSREVVSKWRLVVTACGQLPVSGTATVPLGELVEFLQGPTCFIPVVDPLTIVGVPISPKTGAPNRFGENCMALIRSRIASGTALSGRNEEARAVYTQLQRDLGPNAPSLPTVKKYVTEARSG